MARTGSGGPADLFQFVDAFATALTEDKGVVAHTALRRPKSLAGVHAVIGELESLTVESPLSRPLWAPNGIAYYLPTVQSRRSRPSG